MQLAQKLVHQGSSDVLAMDLIMKPQAVTYGRNRKRRDDRQAIVTVPGVLDGSFAAWSPRAHANRLQHKAAFVEKNDASMPFRPPFLSVAIPALASVRWPPRRAL